MDTYQDLRALLESLQENTEERLPGETVRRAFTDKVASCADEGRPYARVISGMVTQYGPTNRPVNERYVDVRTNDSSDVDGEIHAVFDRLLAGHGDLIVLHGLPISGALITVGDHCVGGFFNRELGRHKSNYLIKSYYSAVVDWIEDCIVASHDTVPEKQVIRLLINKQNDTIRPKREDLTETTQSIDPALLYPEHPLPGELWDRFNTANGRVLLMQGEGGTGKSNYVREMLNHRGWDDAFLVDNEHVFLRDDFIDFVREKLRDQSVLVIEDGDRLLSAREDGNTRMAALLNAISGIATKDVRIIITINLRNLKGVDEAILRSGRLYRLMHFEALSLRQSQALRESLGGDPNDLTHETGYTVGDIINYDENNQKMKDHQSAIGFT